MKKFFLTNDAPEKTIEINPEINELYMEWGVFERDVDTGVLTHVSPDQAGAASIKIEKQICFEDTAWESFEGTPYLVTDTTKLPPTRIVGGKYRFTVIGLDVNREMIVCVYPRY